MCLLWNRLVGYHQPIESVLALKKSLTEYLSCPQRPKSQPETKITAKQCLPWLPHYGVQVKQFLSHEVPDVTPPMVEQSTSSSGLCTGLDVTQRNITLSGKGIYHLLGRKDKGGEAVWGHLSSHSPLQPPDSCGFNFGAQVGHGLEQSPGMGCMWWAEKLTGFQRCPWLLLSMCEMFWFCSTWRGREEGWGRNGISWSGVWNDLHRTISGSCSSQCHCLHPHCWLQSIPQWPPHFWWVSEHHSSGTVWTGGNVGFHKDGNSPPPWVPTRGLWERFGCRGCSECRQGLDQEHLTHLFGLSSSLQDLICLQVVQLLAPPLLWVPSREASRSPFSPFYLSTEHTVQGLIYIWAAVCMKVHTRQLSHQKS